MPERLMTKVFLKFESSAAYFYYVLCQVTFLISLNFGNDLKNSLNVLSR